jgi:hypothetical protein
MVLKRDIDLVASRNPAMRSVAEGIKIIIEDLGRGHE